MLISLLYQRERERPYILASIKASEVKKRGEFCLRAFFVSVKLSRKWNLDIRSWVVVFLVNVTKLTPDMTILFLLTSIQVVNTQSYFQLIVSMIHAKLHNKQSLELTKYKSNIMKNIYTYTNSEDTKLLKMHLKLTFSYLFLWRCEDKKLTSSKGIQNTKKIQPHEGAAGAKNSTSVGDHLCQKFFYCKYKLILLNMNF